MPTSPVIDFLIIFAVVSIGNTISSFFYLQNLLSGHDISAVLSRPRAMLSLSRWFILNIIIGLAAGWVCLQTDIKYPIILVFILSVLPSTLSYIDREQKRKIKKLATNNLKRFLYDLIFDKIMILQKWTIQPFIDEKDDVQSQKNEELKNAVNDLRFIFGEKNIESYFEILNKSHKLPSPLRKRLKAADNMNSKLELLLKTYNLDILRQLLHFDSPVRKMIEDRHIIRKAHKRKVTIFDSVHHPIFSFVKQWSHN